MESGYDVREGGCVGFLIVDDAVLLSPFVSMWHTKISPGRYLFKGAMNPNKVDFVVNGSGPYCIGGQCLHTQHESR